MPELIEYVDAIARREARDVLFLEFHPVDQWRAYRYEDDAMRSSVLRWLVKHTVAWAPCGPFADPGTTVPYLGQVRVDTVYDAAAPAYIALRSYLEREDGTMRHEGVRFCVMPLAYAVRNAAHDEPGFWESIAEDF